MNIKKILFKSMVCASALVSSYVGSYAIGLSGSVLDKSLFSVSEARFSDISIAEERRLATESIAKTRNDPTVIAIKDNPALLRIQKEIVEGNKGVLWFRDANHDYGLRPIKEIEYVVNDKAFRVRAYNGGDGHIFISSGWLMVENANMNGSMVMRSNHPSSIYNNSAIAFTVGHEIAHWKNNQLYHRTDKQDVQFENQADLSACEYMDGTMAYGYGGNLISLYRSLTGNEGIVDSKHEPVDVSYQKIANYINRASNGRIKIDIKGNCTFDGKPIALLNNSKMAPHSNVLEVVAEERTMYVAGQIAFAIKYGVWNVKNMDILTQDDLFHNGNQRIVLVVNNPKTGGYKIIDKFDIKRSRYMEIMVAEIKGDKAFFNSLNEEEKYFLSLWRTI